MGCKGRDTIHMCLLTGGLWLGVHMHGFINLFLFESSDCWLLAFVLCSVLEMWLQKKEKLLLSNEAEIRPHKDDSEMKAYIKYHIENVTGALEWGQKNEERYPKLCRAAKGIYSIQYTSTSSEGLFTKDGFITIKTWSTHLRARLASWFSSSVIWKSINQRTVVTQY